MMHDRRVRVLVLTLSVFAMLVGATPSLNPLVTRTAQPTGAVPDDCNQSLAPAPTPRVDVASLPEPEIRPVSIAAPPSRSLRNELGAAHAALVRNDRPAFDEHLTNARELLAANYPPGAERTAAEDAVRAFDDASRLWDAQFESPFFDETSDAYARASRYPGYADAVRRGMFTDDQDRRFYPAAESRDFITTIAGQRLARLGITTPTRIARTDRAPEPPRTVTRNVPSSSPSKSAPSVSTPSKSAPSVSAPSRSASTSTSTSTGQRRAPRANSSKRRTTTASSSSRNKSSITRPSSSVASAGSASTSPDPSTPRPAATAPAPAAPPAAAPTPSASASPVAVGLPPAAPDPAPSSTDDPADPASSPADAPADTADLGDTTGTTGTTSTTGTTLTTAPDATTDIPATTPAERRSVVVPALLILIGLGVLVVLFRASK